MSLKTRFSDKFELFQKEGLGSIRTLLADNGEVWFIGTDVCKCLGLDQSSRAYMRLKDYEKMTLTTSKGHSGHRGGAQSLVAISESGMYRLVLTSKKKEAEHFQDWVTTIVLPSIRKNGGYIYGQEDILKPSDRAKYEGLVQILSAKVAKLQKRRHELIAGQQNLKEKVKKDKKELKKRNECLDTYEDLIDAFYSDYVAVLAENKKLREKVERQRDPVISNKPVPEPTYYLDEQSNRYETREDAVRAIRSSVER